MLHNIAHYWIQFDTLNLVVPRKWDWYIDYIDINDISFKIYIDICKPLTLRLVVFVRATYLQNNAFDSQ